MRRREEQVVVLHEIGLAQDVDLEEQSGEHHQHPRLEDAVVFEPPQRDEARTKDFAIERTLLSGLLDRSAYPGCATVLRFTR
ncbi:hypothetical protein GCM10028793_50350 [Nocardiopsis oceani]